MTTAIEPEQQVYMALGWKDDGSMGLFPADKTGNIGLFGSSGHGKTTVIEFMVSQCVEKDLGFALADPHGEAAKRAAARLKSAGKKFIYIAPRLAMETGKAVKINALDIEPAYVNTFISHLKVMNRNAWGSRQEAILGNGILGLAALGMKQYKNLNTLLDIINKPAQMLQLISRFPRIPREFFQLTFPTYSQEAGSAAYNKIAPFLRNPLAASVLIAAGEDKALDFVQAVRSNTSIILDLSEIDEDTKSFIGSLVILQLASAMDRLVERRERTKRPYFLFVDEVQKFAAVVREPMNKSRKFGMVTVIATQSLDDKEVPFANEIDAVTGTVCAFRMANSTSKKLLDSLPFPPRDVAATMANLPKFTFAGYSNVGKFILRTKQIPEHYAAHLNPYNPDCDMAIQQAIEESIQEYGSPARIEEYMPKDYDAFAPVQPPMDNPVDWAVLCFLWKHGNSAGWQYLRSKLAGELGIKESLIDESVRMLRQDLLVSTDVKDMNAVGTDGTDANAVALMNMAVSRFFRDIPVGPRSGKHEHVDVMMRIAAIEMERYNYPYVDTGKIAGQLPDVTVITYSKAPGDGNRLVWRSDKVRAFEVETDPVGSQEQLVKNYYKCANKSFSLIYVTYSEEQRASIYRILAEKGIPAANYQVWLDSDLSEPMRREMIMQKHRAAAEKQQNELQQTASKNPPIVDNSVRETKKIEQKAPQKAALVEGGGTDMLPSKKKLLKASCYEGRPHEEVLQWFQSQGYKETRYTDGKGRHRLRVRKDSSHDYDYEIKGPKP